MSKAIPFETDDGVIHVYPEHIVGVGGAVDGETYLFVAQFNGIRIHGVSTEELLERLDGARGDDGE